MRAGRGFQLFLLTIAAFGGAYSRTLLGPLQETIRMSLGIGDNRMAILQGPALTLPLVISIIPLGFMVDRHRRVRLLLILAGLNLLGTLLTAAASSFEVLLIGRCIAGFSAFAVNPVVLSLIGDIFAPGERGRATMAMSLGQYAGMSVAFGFGGFLLTVFDPDPSGWRWSALWMTGPLVFVSLMMIAAREPTRTDIAVKSSSAKVAFRELWQLRKAVTPLLIGVVMAEIAVGAIQIWAAPTLSRRFGLPADRIGTVMAAGLLFSGVLGPIVGGTLADYCQKTGGPRRTAFVLFALSALSAPAVLFDFVPDVTSASALLVLYIAMCSAICVMGTAMFIVVIPNELRGLCVGILTAAVVFVGNGLAPLSVSLLSGAMGGPSMIGEALAAIGVTASILGAVSFAIGSRSFAALSKMNESVRARA